jgi:hypothetical protein
VSHYRVGAGGDDFVILRYLDGGSAVAVFLLIIPNWQISSKILKLLKMRHENASSASRSNRIPDSGGA